MSSATCSDYPPEYCKENRSARILVTAIVFIVLDTVSFILRTLSRSIGEIEWMWSDIFMPLSLLFNLAVCTDGLLAYRWGAGRHAITLPPSDLDNWKRLIYYGWLPIYLLAVVWPKLALLDLYLHVFVNKYARYTCYATGAIIILNCIVNLPLAYFRCHVFNQGYNPQHPGHCINIHLHSAWVSFANIITDLIMIILPIPLIIRLRQPLSVKLGTIATFLVGNVGLAASIVRFIEFYKLDWYNRREDYTYTTVDYVVWLIVEPSVYHLAACFITFRPLFRWLLAAISNTQERVRRSVLFNQRKTEENEPVNGFDDSPISTSTPSSRSSSRPSTRPSSTHTRSTCPSLQLNTQRPISSLDRYQMHLDPPSPASLSTPEHQRRSRRESYRSRQGSHGGISVRHSYYVRHGVPTEQLPSDSWVSSNWDIPGSPTSEWRDSMRSRNSRT